MNKPAKIIAYLLLASIIVFGLMQLIPFGKDHSNPPVVQEPDWDSAENRALVKRACFDCHSHETVWPWYSNIAPSSWLVQRDVERGRKKMNFSDWGRRSEDAEEIREVILEGEMPLPTYLLMHAEARLTEEEKLRLIEGFMRSLPED